jgi:hypothetical protein
MIADAFGRCGVSLNWELLMIWWFVNEWNKDAKDENMYSTLNGHRCNKAHQYCKILKQIGKTSMKWRRVVKSDQYHQEINGTHTVQYATQMQHYANALHEWFTRYILYTYTHMNMSKPQYNTIVPQDPNIIK